jgi:hypothetical protein
MLEFLMKYLLTFLFLLTCLQVQSETTYTKEEALSEEIATHVIGETVKRKAIFPYEKHNFVAGLYNTGTTRWPQDVMLFWRIQGEHLKLAELVQSEKGETFARPEFFSVQEHTFVNISTEPSGSGGFVRDLIYWIAPDGMMHEVPFQHASELFEGLEPSEQIVLSGGDKEFFIDEKGMRFQFWLGSEGDPHCCPSGGTVTGTYKLTGSGQYDSFRRVYVSTFKVIPDHLQQAAPTGVLAEPSMDSTR